MQEIELTIDIDTLESKINQLINYNGQVLIYRKIDKYYPDNDKKVELKTFSNINPILDKIVLFCETNQSGKFIAKDVLDGVMYNITFNDKGWYLFCPDMAPNENLKELGKLIDEVIKYADDT